MNVSACLVTRGDVDMDLILDSLPKEWEIVIWDNGAGYVTILPDTPRGDRCYEDGPRVQDLAVYGRYAAIEYATYDLIFVQDDDVIVSDPQAIVDELENAKVWPEDYVWENGAVPSGNEFVVCNMPHEFRLHYPDSGLVGFGAAFHRDAPRRAFDRFDEWYNLNVDGPFDPERGPRFNRRADNIFTALTPRVLVDVPKRDLDYASDLNRMWLQPDHEGEKQRMLELARKVRDGR